MEIEKCYETLELTPHATLEDVQQAYKDMVNIWHPDRVQNNARLKKKADEKLKAINVAYSELTAFLSEDRKTKKAVRPDASKAPVYNASRTADSTSEGEKDDKPQPEPKPAQGFFQNLGTLLNRALDALVRMPAQSRDTLQDRPERYETRSGKGPGRGRGMGKRAGGGRRGGMGRGRNRR